MQIIKTTIEKKQKKITKKLNKIKNKYSKEKKQDHDPLIVIVIRSYFNILYLDFVAINLLMVYMVGYP